MIKLRPPQHRIDGAALYASSTDSAWDLDKVRAERVAWVDRAREEKLASGDEQPLTAEEIAAAVARSPVERFFAGKTRYQIGADDWGADGKPTTARDFLKGKPAEFGLRRLGFRAYNEIAEEAKTRARLIEACRLGLRSINADGYSWTAKADEVASDEQLDALHEANPALLVEIGAAVLALSRPLDPESETFR